MASNTYVALDKVTVSGTSTNTITFSSISSSYTDLVVIFNGGATSGNPSLLGRFNSDTGSNYSFTRLTGNGSSAASGRQSNVTSCGISTGIGLSTTFETNTIFQIQNYSNTTTYKTAITRHNTASIGLEANVNLWRSTAAITSVTLFLDTANFAAGSTFTLYGIATASAGVAKATGGTIYQDASYFYHVFSGNGTFTPASTLSCDVLMVAGGGGGGTAAGGGGGAGGLVSSSGTSLSATGYAVTVGSGGAGAASDGQYGATGASSTFNSWTANGGGGGAHGSNSQSAPFAWGNPGGSGGGAGYKTTYDNSAGAATQTSPSGATGYGNAGGSVSFGAGAPYRSAGGGGAGAVGTSITSAVPGVGGIGRTDSLINAIGAATGTGEYSGGNWYFAGGGGGSLNDTAVPGGLGGGGAGGTATVTNYNAKAQNALQYTGGGGGGGEVTGAYVGAGSKAGNGASGIVVIRYAK